MASYIKKGESILIPFRNGQSIVDSQLKPRMYKTVQAFEKSFPSYYLGNNGVELVEYVEVVRCKDCKDHDRCEVEDLLVKFLCIENAYCAAGERKQNGV